MPFNSGLLEKNAAMGYNLQLNNDNNSNSNNNNDNLDLYHIF